MYIWSIIALLIVFYIGYVFFKEIGNSFPILELMLLMAGMQWLLGAFNAYRLSVQHFKYYMYVSETEYMSYVVPAFLVYALIILFVLRKNKVLFDFKITPYLPYARWILLAGIVAELIINSVPGGLRFFVFLVIQFKYVGAGVLLFSKKPKDKYVFYVGLTYLLLRSVAYALFHDLILWSLLFFLFWAIKNKPTAKTKLIVFASGIFFVISIQMVKASFRRIVWEGGYEGSKTVLFYEILSESLGGDYFEDENNMSTLNVRLNQGWIISAIMDYVPDGIEHANGTTVNQAIVSSILPRFLNPTSIVAGGKENFTKYTGLELGKGTSMGMSLIGEAYVNYGRKGWVFMMIWALFLSFYWKRLLKVCKNHPLLVFFIPLLFLQVVKAETELYVVLNHLLKSTFLVWMFFKFAKKYLNWDI